MAVLQTLLIGEAMLITKQQQSLQLSNSKVEHNRNRRCTSCFQLIAFDIMLNATFDPWIIEVNGQPNLQEASRDESPAAAKVKKFVVDDLINLISSTDTQNVAIDVAEALEEVMSENIGVMGISCHISHDLCLSNDDLSYLVQSRREALSKSGFKPLYPSLEAQSQRQLIDELNQMISLSAISNNHHSNALSLHKTADIHQLLMSLERFYYRHLIDEEFGDAAGDLNANQRFGDDYLPNNNNSISNLKFMPFSANGCSDGEIKFLHAAFHRLRSSCCFA